MHTVMGLRAQRQRAALAAHPEGELYRRMSEGTDLIPLAPRNEIDLAAAWRLSRVLKQLRPDIIHAHDPHGVAMAATALSIASPSPEPPLVASRRIEFRIAHNSFSRWKYGRVACFIAISEAVQNRLDHGRHPDDRRPRSSTRALTSNASCIFRRPTYMPHSFCRLTRRSSATSARSWRRRANTISSTPRRSSSAQFQTRASSFLAKASCARQLEEQIKRKHLERHVFLAGFRPDVLELLKGVDLFALSSLQEGLCTSLVDAMAASKAAVATRVGGVPEVVADGETGLLVPPRDHEALAEGITALLKDDARRTRMGEAGLKRARKLFTVEHMVEGTIAAYERLLGVKGR